MKAVQAQREQWIDRQMSTPKIPSDAVSGFLAAFNATTKGVDVQFTISDTTGIDSISLMRATVLDFQKATVLQSWSAISSSHIWSDTDATLQQAKAVYYWIYLKPLNFNGTPVIVGPQSVSLSNPSAPPTALTSVAASGSVSFNGLITVVCNTSPLTSPSVKIYAIGYQGNTAPVAVAQSASEPVQFQLYATGETVTLKAVAVSSSGIEASGPTCTLTLDGLGTVPAAPQDVKSVQVANGNQITWSSSLENGILNYPIYRSNRGAGFGAAALLATVPAASVMQMSYLDTTGLQGTYDYYVLAVSGVGSSLPSPASSTNMVIASGSNYGVTTSTGITATVALAKLSLGGSNGSAVFTSGVLTAYTPPT